MPCSLEGRDVFSVVKLLREAPTRFRARLAPLLQPLILFAGDPVFEEGEFGDAMFFINTGLVDLLLHENSVREKKISTIGDGSYFGDSGLLFGDGRRTATARCQTNCVIYRCENKDMHALLRDFPQVFERFVEVAQRRQQKTDAVVAAHHVTSLSETTDVTVAEQHTKTEKDKEPTVV